MFEFCNASSVLQRWVSGTAHPQLWNMGEPGLKVLYYEVINAGLLLAKTSRKSREVSVSDPQNIAAEKAYNNSPSSPSSETTIVLIILILGACLLSVKYAKSLTLFFELVQLNSEFFSYSVSHCALVGSWNVTAATPLLQVAGRSCQSKSGMKGLAKYREYFREGSGLADGAHVHMLVGQISPQIVSELLNY